MLSGVEKLSLIALWLRIDFSYCPAFPVRIFIIQSSAMQSSKNWNLDAKWRRETHSCCLVVERLTYCENGALLGSRTTLLSIQALDCVTGLHMIDPRLVENFRQQGAVRNFTCFGRQRTVHILDKIQMMRKGIC